jgi:hypothetical protein
MGVALNGDYILVGGNTGTVVFKIDAGGSGLAVTQVAAPDGAGNHWLKDNGAYVLESKSGAGTVKVWKWNGADPPTALGTVDINGTNTGNIQALSFDPDDPAKAYFYCKLAAGTGNGGNVYRVNLTDSSLAKTLEFQFPSLVYNVGVTPTDLPLTGLWNIEKQTYGSDDYFVFSGAITPTTGTIGVVLTIKNPVSTSYGGGGGTTVDSRVQVETFTAPYAATVRTLKTFRSSSGAYFAAKNYTASGANWYASNYKLLLERLD